MPAMNAGSPLRSGRLVRKLVLALVVGMLGVLATDGILQVDREVGLFASDTARDLRTLGRAVARAATHVMRVEGPEAAQRLVAAARDPRSSMTLRWVWLDGGAPAPAPALGAARQALRDGQAVTLRTPAGLYGWSPVPGARPAAVELLADQTDERSYLRETIVRQVLSALAMALVAAILAVLLGQRLLGRPVAQLIDKARRIGSGDLESPRLPVSLDELGELAAEVNSMCDRLREARSRLTAEATARIEALEQLRHADRLTTVGRLASGIAHELGTPLQVVAGRARMITTGESTGDDAVRDARIVVEQSTRMTQIIRQLLDFARRGGSTSAASRQEIRLAGVCTRVLELLEPMARGRGVTLVAPAGDATVSADAAALEQAVTNLVVNAVEASRQGTTVRLSVEGLAGRNPDLSGAGPLPCSCVVVEDEGSGITPDDLDRVFEPFFTTKDVGEGTGLGLSVAHGIAREHGGWIAAESTPGKGSRFTLYLPRNVGA